MLDITGSMAGQKLADMKAAAKDLVNIVVWKPGGTYTSRVALAPFSVGMNAGALTASIAASLPNAITVSGTVMKLTRRTASPSGPGSRRSRMCPVCRQAGAHVQHRRQVHPQQPDRAADERQDQAGRHRRVRGEGSTSGHLGTAGVVPAVAELEQRAARRKPPRRLRRLTATSASGQPKLRKIAVLMTDGEYNNQFCNGLPDKYSNSVRAEAARRRTARPRSRRASCARA